VVFGDPFGVLGGYLPESHVANGSIRKSTLEFVFHHTASLI
jgi:hypothetical protein